MFKVYRKHPTGGLFASFEEAMQYIELLAQSDSSGVSYSIKRIAASHFMVYRRHAMHKRSQTFVDCEAMIENYSKAFDGEFEIVVVTK